VRDGTAIEVLKKQVPPTEPGGAARWVNFTGDEVIAVSNASEFSDGQEIEIAKGAPAAAR
jgi:hypothetical protein